MQSADYEDYARFRDCFSMAHLKSAIGNALLLVWPTKLSTSAPSLHLMHLVSRVLCVTLSTIEPFDMDAIKYQ